MRRIAFCIALLFFVMFAGCNNSSLSNSDENSPNPNNNSPQTESSPNTHLPQIMLDDVYYYLSSEKNPVIEVAESDFSGRVLSTVPLSQRPVENGQANFNVDVGAPYAQYENGIVVLWNEKWTIFVTKNEHFSEGYPMLDVDRISIEYEVTNDEKNDVDITETETMLKIISLCEPAKFEYTSTPMMFPRFNINFYYNGEIVADFHIDKNDVISGSRLGIGNHALPDNSVFNDLQEIFDNY